MLKEKYLTDKELKNIQTIIKQLYQQLNPRPLLLFNKSDIDSGFGDFYIANINTHIPAITIGMNYDIKYTGVLYDFNTALVVSTISLYHEYEHYLQYRDKTISEITWSIKFGKICPQYNFFKYSMLPQELDAEITGINKAKEVLEQVYQGIDFEKSFLNYVNNIERWYGPEPLRENRPKFSSYEEAMDFLYKNYQGCYNFPSSYQYPYFSTKMESINVSKLENGAKQISLIMEIEASKNEKLQPYADLANQYEQFYCQDVAQTIDDVILDIPKENSASSIIQDDIDIEKEGIDYEDE